MDAMKNKKKSKEEYLLCFINFRDKHPDKNCYYARYLDFVQKVTWNLFLMAETGIVEDAESIERIKQFIQYAKNMAQKEEITEENIDRTKEIINFAIEILSESDFKKQVYFCRA